MNNWNEMELDELRKWLTGVLKEEVVTIKFTKKDGTDRVMKATLHDRLVANTNGVGKKENAGVISVTDVELDQWRSIRLDSIKEISFELGGIQNQ
jgi:hypothetical protein